MKVIRSLEDLQLPASAVAIGMFDGVHTGHRMVLESTLRKAHALGLPATVFSFANHPQGVVSNSTPQLLSTLEERLMAFEAAGIDIAVVPDFTPAMRELTPDQFIHDVLLAKLGAKSISIGYDHHFGKNRAGNSDLLKTIGDRLGFDVQVIAPVRIENHEIVSSSLIRKLLSYGDVDEATALLGKPYILTGTVVQGFGRGRQLGFPTANLQPPAGRLMPATGVYAGLAALGSTLHSAVCNIGFSPTFDGGTPEKRMEVFLLSYSGPEFYNDTMAFSFLHKIRGEQKFESKDALIAQIHIDCAHAKDLLRESLSDNTQNNPVAERG